LPKAAAKHSRLSRGFSNKALHAVTWIPTPTSAVHMASYTL
jgi:hypothetical protein